MAGWMWIWVLTAWAGESTNIEDQQQVSIEYKLSFDMDARGDAACKLTKLCDCTARYIGEGKRVEKGEGVMTFKGIWKKVESTCSDSFEPWSGEDGAAFHTLRWDVTTKKVSEWVVHADQDKSERLASGIKASEQYWVSEIDTAMDSDSRTLTYVEKAAEKVSVLTVDTTHELLLQFKPKGG